MLKDSSIKKSILGVVMATLPVFCASVLIIADSVSFSRSAVSEGYEITLDSSTKLTTGSSLDSNTFRTQNGNEYMISFNGCSDTGNNFTTINAGGYFTTKNAINGLASLSFTTNNTNSVKVGYGWAEGLQNIYGYKVFSGSTSYTYDFNGKGPSYFSFQNTSSNASVSIVSLSLNYSCEATERPSDVTEAYLVDGQAMNAAIKKGKYSTILFSSKDYAVAQGATAVSSAGSLKASGSVAINLYAKGSTAYIAADAERPSIVFNSNCKGFFAQCESLINIGIAEGAFIDTSKVVTFEEFFYNVRNINATKMNEFLNNFSTVSARNFASMFKDNHNITEIDLSFVDFTAPEGVDLQQMFYNCSSLKKVTFSKKKMSKFAIADQQHQWYLGAFGHCFRSCRELTELDLSSFNFSSSTPINAQGAFAECSKLKKIYVSNGSFNFESNGNDWNGTFFGCNALVGGAGSTFDSSKCSSQYARIDKVGQFGYFTVK